MESWVKRGALSSRWEDNTNYVSDSVSAEEDSDKEDEECVNLVELKSDGSDNHFYHGRLGPQLVQEPERVDRNGCVAAELSFAEAPLSSITREKCRQIEAALAEDPVDTLKLKKLALSEGGLVNDALRRKVWPKLLGLDTQAATEPPTEKELEAHAEYHQVVLDVDRSLKRFPPGIPYEQRVALQDQLTRLILRVIIKYPHLRYYQGYHDVAVTFLLVVGEADAFQIMEKLSTEHLKECMEPTMDKTSYLLNYIYPLILRVNPELYEYMERSGVGTMFCLPWFLTWYGHSLNQYGDVIPDNVPFESLLKQATKLHEDYPPRSIEAEVQERFKKELQLRRYDDRPQTPRVRRHNLRALWHYVAEMDRLLPHWALVRHVAVPRFRSRFVFVTTAALFGLYAYFRMADALGVNSSLPVR
ncbi:TBC1 domain family member 20 isoform X2 [Zootermopsis nevadensis]|uniref:TBC1 domain family member 20 isoform X2 n=1 Tax=Zootermopsis nevadensis TaxID=136037 RepID=UPI000B8E2F1E|nr:TBC1 domain family member 20 isoform X2 [Zootermopsis nevadensis]